MKTVLVLGAGMVSRPLVGYLLAHDYHVVLGDLVESQALAVIDGHPNGCGLRLESGDEAGVLELMQGADLVVSLLPPSMHPRMAQLSLEAGVHFLTASYLSPEMEALDAAAKAKGLIFLNEVGLDPGLDHMTAMDMIDSLKESGYEILGFDSHCGGIPSRKAANTPLRYKLSWSPAGVLGAVTRPARYRRDGELVVVPGAENLQWAEVLHVPGAGIFESNPNGDALFYGERYGLTDSPTVRRGTLRYPGWARFWSFMVAMGFQDRERRATFRDEPVLSALFSLAGHEPPADIIAFVRRRDPGHASCILEGMESLGLLDPSVRVSGLLSAFDMLLARMNASMGYQPGERDLVSLHDILTARIQGRTERWTSTLIREGSEEASAMAFLVGVPAGIAARLILEDRIPHSGVQIPLERAVYAPILEELAGMGVPPRVEKAVLTTEV